ncbi:hypothetical protein LAN30_27135, partial [Mycobacterium tuberculosis]|nr:hypothetical protein [Mycobacterium tuberculosis]
TILGSGVADDVVTLSGAVVDATIDLGQGNDTLNLGSATTATITNVETINGGAGVDVITLGTQLTGGTISLGAGRDKLV